MTTEVWKFQLPLQDHVTVRVPKGTKILYVGNQVETLCVWGLVSPRETEVEERHFRIAGTGHPIDINSKCSLNFIGTVLFAGASLVFHVFEIVPKERAVPLTS